MVIVKQFHWFKTIFPKAVEITKIKTGYNKAKEDDTKAVPNRTLRWGIAPVTRIAEDFATSLMVLPKNHHCITSCVDHYKSEARSFADKFDVGNIYMDFEDLARCPSVDAVYISPLNPMHCELCHLMLNHDKNVLCEQPLCMTENQVKELVAKAQARGLFLMEGFWPRCLPAYEMLHRDQMASKFGRIDQITCTMGWPVLSSQMPPYSYGGVTKDLCPYAIQLALWVYREIPQFIKASGQLNQDDIDISADIELSFKGNRTARFVLSAVEKLNNVVIMHGTKGNVMSNAWCPELIKLSKTDYQFVLPQTKQPTIFQNRVGLCYEAEEVRNCILAGRTQSDLFSHKESCLMASLIGQIRDMLGVEQEQVIEQLQAI